MEHPRLADFTASPRLLFISSIAAVIGGCAAFVALALLRLIGLFTNLFYFHRFETALVSPADSGLGAASVLIPVAGGLVIGLMARFGSDRIRGHGIPEALEAILINRSRMEPRVAVLKPLSSAVAIGSGGPFGAEGPIIMTGGAFGSLVAQHLHLTEAERRTLLVAGAAAGMSATFAAPVAAVLLSVELLLFEWRPRSALPVALASAMAAAVRHYVIGPGPLFALPAQPEFPGAAGMAACVVAGLSAGGLSLLLTSAVYAAEDAFSHLKLHWMWWPALGGLIVGAGGLVYPPALGVGYDSIERLLQGDAGMRVVLGILVVKTLIWAGALGSGTSGGVLAPLLMIGAAFGALESRFLPAEAAGFWPLVCMTAALAGTMRSPLTSIVFAIELTHNTNIMLPIALAAFVAYGLSVIVMKRSILTEKVSRRGFHVSRDYAADPLELLLVSDALRFRRAQERRAQAPADGVGAGDAPFVHERDTLRTALQRMLLARAESIDIRNGREGPPSEAISIADILDVRRRLAEDEHRRERLLRFDWRIRAGRRRG